MSNCDDLTTGSGHLQNSNSTTVGSKEGGKVNGQKELDHRALEDGLMTHVCTHGTQMPYGQRPCQLKQCNALGNVLLGDIESCLSCGCYFDTYHLPKQHLWDVPDKQVRSMEAPHHNPEKFYVLDATADLQRVTAVHA